MKAISKQNAWDMAREILQSDYTLDKDSSDRAGYPIYRSTTEHYDYICDLGSRLEINLKDGNKSINVWIEEPPAEPAKDEERENMKARYEVARRIQSLTYYYTEDYVKALDDKKREDAAVKEMQARADAGGGLEMMVLTAEQNAKVVMECITDCIHAVNVLKNTDEDVDDWMLAGINAMIDKVNESKCIPYDLPTSICGLLCAQFR